MGKRQRPQTSTPEHADQVHRFAPEAEDRAWGVVVTGVALGQIPQAAVTAGWRVLFLVRGSGVLLVKGPAPGVRTLAVNAGDVVVLPVSPVARFRPGRNSRCIAHSVDLEGDLVSRWLGAGSLAAAPLVVQAGFDEELLGLVAQLSDLARKTPAGRGRLMAGIAGNVLARLEVLHRLDQGLGRRRRVVAEIRQRLADPAGDWQDLPRLAEDLEVSYTWLRRNFTDLTGTSPHQYRLAQRLTRAQRRLTDTDDSIAQIAQDLGLSSQAYFARLFRRRTGLSPSIWRSHQQRVGPVD